ncbi:hypothetical protein Agabi119p4_6167 [Agaricus bisporus var. burnettii]|uniref:Uncharacterized protein n=1 Tax=Agaricus bisporus var. burnettii TaxID=192524 RepID=A0A8H7KGC3_AGABI|nr:hypothetical protein Agabi119p4_6167 [Agaricus bisporus var. burnettii]
MSNASTTVRYAIVDQSHNIVVGVDSIDVSETLTISGLKKRILEEQGYRDVKPALTDVYRSESLNATAEPDDEFQEKVSALLNKSKPLAVAKKIRDYSIREEELLFVELPWRDVWYCLVDQSHEIVARVDCIDISKALTINKLMEKVKEKHTLQEDDFQANVSACLNKSKPLAFAKKIRDCGIGEEEILFVELPWRDVSYCLVDKSHEIIARVDSIVVSEALTIAKLMEKVKEKHTLQEDDFQANVSAFLNKSKPLWSLKTIQALDIGKEEILFVALPWIQPVDVWYRLVDHENIFKGALNKVSAATVLDLMHCVKDTRSNDLSHVDAQSLVRSWPREEGHVDRAVPCPAPLTFGHAYSSALLTSLDALSALPPSAHHRRRYPP